MKNQVKLFIFAVLTLGGALQSAQAQGVPMRPLSVFIHEPSDDKVQREDIMFSLGVNRESPMGPFVVLNKDGARICEGVLGSRGRNWLFRQVKCVFSEETVPELVLVQKRSWGVINHGATKFKFSNGVVIGFLIHIGSEQEEQSRVLVKDSDIRELYGEFPNWKLPEN
jgi:hypothetical protein